MTTKKLKLVRTQSKLHDKQMKFIDEIRMVAKNLEYRKPLLSTTSRQSFVTPSLQPGPPVSMPPTNPPESIPIKGESSANSFFVNPIRSGLGSNEHLTQGRPLEEK